MVKIVSPIYRLSPHDFLVVETSLGRQAFYRSTGIRSGQKDKWFPVDEIVLANGWLNKTVYTEGLRLSRGKPLHRLGNEEFAKISEELTAMKLPQGQKVPAGANENEGATLNRILDFFNCRLTPGNVFRPMPE